MSLMDEFKHFAGIGPGPWTTKRVVNDVKNAGANVAWGAQDWGNAGRNLGAVFTGKDSSGKNLSLMGRITKGLAGIGDAALGAGAAASTASLLIPGVGEAVKGADLGIEGGLAAARGVKAADAAAEGVKGVTAPKTTLPPKDTFVPKPKNEGGMSGGSQFIGPKAPTPSDTFVPKPKSEGGMGGGSQFIGPKAPTPSAGSFMETPGYQRGSTVVETKPSTTVKPYTEPRTVPDATPGYPKTSRSTTIGDRPPLTVEEPPTKTTVNPVIDRPPLKSDDLVPAPATKPKFKPITDRPPINTDAPAPAPKPQLKPITGVTPGVKPITSELPATESSTETETKPITSEETQPSRSTAFKTAAAAAAGTAIGVALLGPGKSGTPDKWNPSSIV
jgi:hypothetical protein